MSKQAVVDWQGITRALKKGARARATGDFFFMSVEVGRANITCELKSGFRKRPFYKGDIFSVAGFRQRRNGGVILQLSLQDLPPNGQRAINLKDERDLIRERTTDGLAAARAAGRVGGRRRVMTPEKLAEARKLALDGYRAGEIATRIEVSKSTVLNHWKLLIEGDAPDGERT